MCGRFQLTATPQELAEAFEVDEPAALPRYNIAPAQPVLVVREAGGGRRIDAVRWGLVPHFASEPTGGERAINARAETVATRPTFREALRRRRCLVPAQGFYEWQRRGTVKQPYLIRPVGGGLMAFAGLWERWEASGAAPLETCTIVTVPANALVAPVHDRMPAVLDRTDHARWLDPRATDAAAVTALLRPARDGALEMIAVSTRVNHVANDDPGCAEPADPEAHDVQRRLF